MTLRKLAGDTLIYGTGYILGKVLNYLLITIYLTWKFDGETEQYGLYTDFYFYVALLLVLLTLRMETTFFRFASDTAMRKTVFSQSCLILMVTAVAWTVFIFLFQTPIANFLQYPGYEKHVVTLGLIIALDVLVAVPFAAFRLEGRPIRYSILRILGILCNIAAVIFFFEIAPRLAEQGLADWYRHEDRLYYVFLANFIGSLIVFMLFIPQLFRIHWSWDGRLMKRMLIYALPLVVVGIAGVINQSSYITFQKYILPNSLIENLSTGGVYAAATRLAIIMSLFTTAFNYAAEPFFFQHAKAEGAKQTYADVAKAFTIAASILMVGILLYLDLIQYIIGTSYREYLGVVPILLTGFLFLGLYYNVSAWYKITDKTHLGALISTVASVLTIGLNILLIPAMGVVGSAWAALACYGFMITACYALGRRYYPVPYDLKVIALTIAGALIVYWISVIIKDIIGGALWLNLLISTILLGVYIAVLYRMEGRLILSVFKRQPGSTPLVSPVSETPLS
jgi:O-antigen/teichoic acid export membrane protein